MMSSIVKPCDYNIDNLTFAPYLIPRRSPYNQYYYHPITAAEAP